ncbi:MAG: hypothetical protein J0M12_06310 [Deltaproteobacteria bacterium]|nr:hypothetical protein [Deltaproteobacteria bacterium]
MTVGLPARIGQQSTATSAAREALASLASTANATEIGVTAQQAAAESLGQTLFNAKLEKHLDDVSHGQANLSSDVAEALFQKGQDTSAALAQSDPAALKDYAAYSTILGYNNRARYVSALDQTTRTLSNIPSQEEAKAATDELVKAFYPNSDAGGIKGK